MKRKTALLLIIAALVILLFVACALAFHGVILLNNPSTTKYPVRGVDVSSYQGEIDWQVLSQQGISFAFIKATEGSRYVDPCFEQNYAEAAKTSLRIGAYHFFSFDSLGKTQAENFIAQVKPIENMLPPVVDLEFYGDKEKDPPEPAIVRQQLDVLLQELEAYYGMKPVLYSTEKAYDLYLAGQYTDNDIWFRDVIGFPKLSDGRQWTFWQFTNRGRLEGYRGTETYIDLNVFYGSREDFAAYGKTDPKP